MTGWQIQFYDAKRHAWALSGTWCRYDAPPALADLRLDYPDTRWRLIWNGLVQDPAPPIAQDRRIPFLRIAA